MAMDAREVTRLSSDLNKATTAQESASSVLPILEALRKGVSATEDLLRTTKVGKAVNRLRTHKNPAVARAAGDLVGKWKRDMKPGGGGGKDGKDGGSAPGTPTVGEDGESQGKRGGTGANTPTSGKTNDAKDGVNGKEFKPSVPLDRRNSQTDNISTDVTGNATRDGCLKLMYDALANNSSESPSHILSIAKAIESAALHSLGPETQPAYKTKIRSLFQVLKSKSNPHLRVQLLDHSLSPTRLISMSPDELKSPERREEDRQMMKENMDKAMVAQVEKSISSSLQCGKCGQRKVSYSQAQTRSADEPMTTFCECTVCGNRWKFS